MNPDWVGASGFILIRPFLGPRQPFLINKLKQKEEGRHCVSLRRLLKSLLMSLNSSTLYLYHLSPEAALFSVQCTFMVCGSNFQKRPWVSRMNRFQLFQQWLTLYFPFLCFCNRLPFFTKITYFSFLLLNFCPVIKTVCDSARIQIPSGFRGLWGGSFISCDWTLSSREKITVLVGGL